MRSNYPVSSQELNDIIFSAFEHLSYLLSYENESGLLISGHLDILDTSASNSFLSGVLNLNDKSDIDEDSDLGALSGYMDIADFLRMDYIYRKYYETEA